MELLLSQVGSKSQSSWCSEPMGGGRGWRGSPWMARGVGSNLCAHVVISWDIPRSAVGTPGEAS